MKRTFTLMLILIMTISCQQKDAEINANQIKPKEVKTVEISETPTLKACTKEAKICPDGQTVSRNPKNNCEFNPCLNKSSKATQKMCTADVKECPDGSYVGRDHYNNCKFKTCPKSQIPTQ